jgi:hypothetical protein
MFVDTNPFLFRGKVCGAMVRLSNSLIVNVTSGGGETGSSLLTMQRNSVELLRSLHPRQTIRLFLDENGIRIEAADLQRHCAIFERTGTAIARPTKA